MPTRFRSQITTIAFFRCLGAAVIKRWNTIPTKLQKELFDNASSLGDLLQTDALKGQIARFLHIHKDDQG